ncbi:condensin complex subunit 2, partial [Copidosoma floridanum]|uniref:condensin complex subunit 2 n=1 Tax=Copidosoma floridanum TaxID=29053 RepID=UPI0006C9A573
SMMSGLSRTSLIAGRIETAEVSPLIASPSRKRRSIATQKVVGTNIEENDDEAERLARREKNDNGSPASSSLSAADRRQSAFGLSAISNLSAAEMSNQIAQCIKLNAENKINDKNAFQLKMIDFLVYALKKQDPNMTNLQMASASLDASAKIYGFRVDKVHSDLLKIIGMAKQDKRDQQEENVCHDIGQIQNKNEKKKKKKRSRQHIISTADTLKGNVEIYDPLSLIRCQRDTQTSDMLFQAGLPQHANQGVALNLHNDVVLDKIPLVNNSNNFFPSFINNFASRKSKICPSYTAFKFLHWSPNDERDEIKSPDDLNGEYHFDLDAAVNDANENDHVLMDCGDAYEECCDRLAKTYQPYENIVDFQDIIVNNPNPDATYEYSYIQKNYRIQWAGPSHWKITLNKNLLGSRVVETCKQNAAKKKKDIELVFTPDSKDEGKVKFGHINRQTRLSAKTTKLVWSEDKVTFPQDVHYDLKRYYIFFKKPTERLKLSDANRDELDDNEEFSNDCDVANGTSEINHVTDGNEEDRIAHHQIRGFTQESILSQGYGGFVGENLVSIPKLTDKIFIPYSQRAKKIDMRQLKKAMWRNLRKMSKETEKENYNITQTESESNKDFESQPFSDTYMKLPRMLSKQNTESLSPSIAFVTLLHLANEKNFFIERNLELSDLIIKSEVNNL